jgi:hypothetical protein
MAIVGLGENELIMKGKYFVAAGAAVVGIAAYAFFRNRKPSPVTPPLKESERHHLTNAFAKAKQVAVGK